MLSNQFDIILVIIFIILHLSGLTLIYFLKRYNHIKSWPLINFVVFFSCYSLSYILVFFFFEVTFAKTYLLFLLLIFSAIFFIIWWNRYDYSYSTFGTFIIYVFTLIALSASVASIVFVFRDTFIYKQQQQIQENRFLDIYFEKGNQFFNAEKYKEALLQFKLFIRSAKPDDERLPIANMKKSASELIIKRNIIYQKDIK